MRSIPSVNQIVQVVAEVTGVPAGLIQNTRGLSTRHRDVVLARYAVVYLARQLTFKSFPELARELYQHNGHSTCVSQLTRAEREIMKKSACGCRIMSIVDAAKSMGLGGEV